MLRRTAARLQQSSWKRSRLTAHTAEPLHVVVFPSGPAARDFIESISRGMGDASLHRRTPPGPLVIYGPRALDEQREVALFVTAGILRAAEILRLHVPATGGILEGAGALPFDTLVLFAMLGGHGEQSRE